MKPFYYAATTNFGDHMNSWLWPRLLPDAIDEDPETRLIGIGSLLSRNLDLVPGRKIIFGTGSGYSSPPTPEQAAAWTIYAVRGPLTAKLLGLAPEQAITDGAWLVNKLPEYATPLPADARQGTVFLPHWTSDNYGAWAPVCAVAGVRYVSPFADCDTVFQALASAERVIAESLHAAILADYFRTPWVPVASPGRVLTFKWLDWCGSLDLPYRPFEMPPSDYVDALLQGHTPARVADRFDGALTAIPINSDPAQWDIARTAPPPARPTLAYRAKIRAKTVARGARNLGLEGLKRLRRAPPLRAWNRTQEAKLVAWFGALAETEAYLSTDDIRARRIAELNAAFDRMAQDLQG